jgi:hypothetical protein
MEALLILDLGTRWGWVVSVTPRPRFTPEERPPVPIGQEAGWASEPVWTQRLEEKEPSASVGDRTPVVQSVTILTELPRLLWLVSLIVTPVTFLSQEIWHRSWTANCVEIAVVIEQLQTYYWISCALRSCWVYMEQQFIPGRKWGLWLE